MLFGLSNSVRIVIVGHETANDIVVSDQGTNPVVKTALCNDLFGALDALVFFIPFFSQQKAGSVASTRSMPSTSTHCYSFLSFSPGARLSPVFTPFNS